MGKRLYHQYMNTIKGGSELGATQIKKRNKKYTKLIDEYDKGFYMATYTEVE